MAKVNDALEKRVIEQTTTTTTRKMAKVNENSVIDPFLIESDNNVTVKNDEDDKDMLWKFQDGIPWDKVWKLNFKTTNIDIKGRDISNGFDNIGIFCIRQIKKGERILHYGWNQLNEDKNFWKLKKEVLKEVATNAQIHHLQRRYYSDETYQVCPSQYTDGGLKIEYLQYINGSSEMSLINCILKNGKIFASRDIEVGQEILISKAQLHICKPGNTTKTLTMSDDFIDTDRADGYPHLQQLFKNDMPGITLMKLDKSNIQGVGVFAFCDLKKNDNLVFSLSTFMGAQHAERKISSATLQQMKECGFPSDVIDVIFRRYMFTISGNIPSFQLPGKGLNLNLFTHFLNYSPTPNLEFDMMATMRQQMGGNNQVKLVGATSFQKVIVKKIIKGTEFFENYVPISLRSNPSPSDMYYLDVTVNQTRPCPIRATCWTCGKNKNVDIKTCVRCKVARYCSKKCQLKNWKTSHKHVCKKWVKRNTCVHRRESENRK